MTVQAMETDILVIGGGLAGTFAAIKAREAGVGKVMLISKGKLGKDSVSTFAAGVFQTFFPEDDTGALMNQFVFNDDFGAGLLDEAWVRAVMDDTYERILDMDRWGVKWEKTSDGKFERIKARHELLKCMFPGPQMMEAMAKKVIDSGVEVIGHTMVTDLLTEGGKAGARVIGAVGFDVRTGQFRVFKAKATLLVSGGCGFKARFACHRFQTGDAYTAAYRAGAELGGFEIGEVLHTTCAHFDTQGLNMFVGLGGKFVNVQGEEFMRDYDPELQNYASMPRLSEASAMEVRAGRGPIE